MKKFLLFLCYFTLCKNSSFALDSCFIAKEDDKVLVSDGDCNTRYTPASTFKIALSLIGFDSGILTSTTIPSWRLPKDTDPYINVCKGDHNPKTWMRDSCLWYSRILTTTLGIKKFQDYMNKLSYGNSDISGGLTNAWISSSLKISTEEQTIFLQKMLNHKLPISAASCDLTKKVMFVQEIAGGWQLYAKTGNDRQFDKNGNKLALQHGWFVGYIEKGNRRIIFANHIVDSSTQDTFASFRAKNDAMNRLWYLINRLEE